MGEIAGVYLSGGREAHISYGWGFTQDASLLEITIAVDHDTTAGLTREDQIAVLQAVESAIGHLS